MRGVCSSVVSLCSQWRGAPCCAPASVLARCLCVVASLGLIVRVLRCRIHSYLFSEPHLHPTLQHAGCAAALKM